MRGERSEKMPEHKLGDVVGVRIQADGTVEDPPWDYGVVVSLPTDRYPYHRVRLRTESFTDYVEVAARESELVAEPEELRRRRQHG